MELRQLEYFITAYEKGSLNKAAEALYTSQPNVSKVIAAFEKEVGCAVFHRTSKGLRLTQKGELIYHHAQHIVKHVSFLDELTGLEQKQVLSIASYQEKIISDLLTELYINNPQAELRYYQGTVEEILFLVENGEAELGLVYLPKDQLSMFQHMLHHKKLEYHEIALSRVCVYVGSRHPLYEKESITFSDLQELKLIRNMRDMFSIENHLMKNHKSFVREEQFHDVIHTDSAFLITSLLERTDMCKLGVEFCQPQNVQKEIRAIPVIDTTPFISMGYVKEQDRELSELANCFLEKLH